jgi:type VI secretion system protein ImpF
MSGLKGRERLQPSLLDRLTDNAPSVKRENFDQQALSMQQLRHAVLRDLGALLNATNLAALEDLSETPMAAKSTINYGIPGFAGMIESAGRVVQLEKELAEAIKQYEPRIRPQTLRVRARGASQDDANTSLVFEIEGELWAQPVPVQLFLETAIEVETRLAVVTEVKGSR